MNGQLKGFLKVKSDSNARKLKALLTPFFKFLNSNGADVESFDEMEVLEYLEEEEYQEYIKKDGPYEPSTKKQVFNAICNFYQWYADRADDYEEYFKRNQRLKRIRNLKSKFKGKKKREVVDRDWLKINELQAILKTARDKKSDDKAFHRIYLAGYFGVRKGEFFASDRIVDIDWDQNLLKIDSEKSSYIRWLFFNDETAQKLRTAIDEGYLDQPWYHKQYARWKNLIQDVNFSPHKLRYTFRHHMGDMLPEDSDDTLIKSLMGHTIKGRDMSDYYNSGKTKEVLKDAMINNHYYQKLKI